jgi:hypothetical protein
LSLPEKKPLALPLRQSRDGVILPVRLTPKSSRDEIVGVEDRGGRAQDYRKLIVTREHGEVGPTLSWIGQKFTSQADIT